MKELPWTSESHQKNDFAEQIAAANSAVGHASCVRTSRARHASWQALSVRHSEKRTSVRDKTSPCGALWLILSELFRPMTCRAEKPGRSASDRKRSPRMRGPAAGRDGEASVPPPFAAIVRVESPPTSSFFPPRLPHLRHLRNLRFRNGRCSGGVSGFSLCLRAFVVNIWANQSPLQMASAGMPAAGQPSRQPSTTAGL